MNDYCFQSRKHFQEMGFAKLIEIPIPRSSKIFMFYLSGQDDAVAKFRDYIRNPSIYISICISFFFFLFVSSVVLYLEFYSSWLISLDGFYNEENIRQPSSSSGSLARRLFDEYRQSVVAVDNIEYDTNPKVNSQQDSKIYASIHQSFFFFFPGFSRVPGLAFRNSVPFMELKELDLQRLAASVQPQLQFYQVYNISCFYISLITAMARIISSYFLLKIQLIK